MVALVATIHAFLTCPISRKPQYGLLPVPPAGRPCAHAKASRLTERLETVLHLYGSRILSIDVITARQIGALADRAREQGHDPGLADLAIAATAMVRGHVVLTRNLRHFAPLGVLALDPFETLPDNVRR